MTRLSRALLALLALLLSPGWALDLRDGDVVLYRHALAPGNGDPPGFQLGDCSTQRNLSDAGRDQALRLGDALRQQLGSLRVTGVWASPWCRTLDTARLAFPDVDVQPQTAFASFYAQSDREAASLAEARSLLSGWRGPGVLVVVTHQVNITGLSGIFPASGEGIAMRWICGDPVVLGRVLADTAEN
ncbi:histidine phosphatase family protein [Roseateles cellulosilyticus]|uniref:Histidine phosphatase family protein n=1 Tax=Pelomonas cellulosilytica TaxID=2906762 RepID=A0ABS8XV30_9BURK|nr:histidine phosphatase family protein [Pelomonas sp. P8]MCE4554481.1 histidine phosphatase family protein [Pelomonas sp. P8]